MKNMILVIGTAALAAVSCSIEENKLEQPAAEGNRMTLSGTVTIGTKVSIGEKDGEVYPLLWSAGDIISINSKDASVSGAFVNEQAELFSETAGETSGLFQTYNPLSPAADMDVVITYPGNSVLYSEGTVTGTVPEKQTQLAPNSSIHVGNYSFAYDEIALKAGQTEDVNFALEQKTAYVKLVLSTSEYSDLNVVSAKLYSPGAQLSGKISYDLASGEPVYSDTKDYAGVTVANPAAFSEAQEFYFTALPCDLTGKDVYVVITMANETQTVTIPVGLEGRELKANCLNIIKVEDVKMSDNRFEWFDPVETRYLAGGWCYGDANTIFSETDGETFLSCCVSTFRISFKVLFEASGTGEGVIA